MCVAVQCTAKAYICKEKNCPLRSTAPLQSEWHLHSALALGTRHLHAVIAVAQFVRFKG